MASIKKETTASGTIRWRARYRAAGRQHEKAFPRRVEAERWIAEQTAAVATGTHSAPALGRITVQEWAEQWWATQQRLKVTTKDRYRGLLDRHIYPTWGKTQLAQVTHSGVAAWVSKLSKSGLSASSVRQAHSVLNRIMGFAVADRRIGYNPCTGVSLPRQVRKEPRFLTRAQVLALADAADPESAVAVLTLAHTGVRFGELVALRVVDLDVQRRRFNVRASTSEVRGKQVTSHTTKTHKGRSVPVPAFLVEHLEPRTVGRSPSDPLFTSPEGGSLRLGNWRRRVFDPACREAGIVDLTPHDLRHTAASLAVQSGAQVLQVQRMLGHASAAMTLDVYAGLFDDDLDTLADRLDEAHRRHRAEGAFEGP